MKIRRATINDIETLLSFGKELHLVEKVFDTSLEYKREEVKSRYNRELNNPLALFLLVEDSNSTHGGYLYAHIDKNVCSLEVIYIEPEFRKKGLASDLITNCIEWSRDKGVEKMTMDIFKKNIASINIFEKFGFTCSNDLKNEQTLIYIKDIN